MTAAPPAIELLPRVKLHPPVGLASIFRVVHARWVCTREVRSRSGAIAFPCWEHTLGGIRLGKTMRVSAAERAESMIF